MALMLAPHTLALTGTLSAEFGTWHGLWIAVIGGLFILNATAYGAWAGTRRRSLPSSDQIDLLPSNKFMLVLVVSGRLTAALMGIAILAVSAGFLFNEIFVYWFPNFAFAYLTLAAVVVIQLLGQTASERAQVLFVSLTVTGLILLILIGLIQEPAATPAPSPVQWPIEVHPIVAALYLFVGFDLFYLSPARQAGRAVGVSSWIIAGIVGGTALLSLWSLVGIRHVEIEALRESTVPHIVTAAKLAGPVGLKLMGIASIAGAVAGINALLKTAALTMADVSARAGIRGDTLAALHFRRYTTQPSVLWTIGLALLIAMLLALGIAGSEAVDVYFRAGLLCWLLQYATVHIANLKNGIMHKSQNRHNRMNLSLLTSGIGILPLVSGIGLLIATDPHKWELIWFLLLVYGTLWLLSYVPPNLIRFFYNARISGVKRQPFNNNPNN